MNNKDQKIVSTQNVVSKISQNDERVIRYKAAANSGHYVSDAVQPSRRTWMEQRKLYR